MLIDTPLELAVAPFALFPAPTETTDSAAPPTPASGAATPVAQIAPALLTLVKTGEGTQQMTVRLHPADLGMVQVRIERGPSGSAKVEITVEKADTLQALLRDQPQLHRTLDDAGIPSAGRSVTFHVAQPAHAQPGPAQPASGSAALGHGGGQQASAGRSDSSNTDAHGSANGGYHARETKPWFGDRRQHGSPAAAEAGSMTTVQSYRIGLDITA